MQESSKKILSPLSLYWEALEASMPNQMIEKSINLSQDNLFIDKYKIRINSKINILAYGKASRLMYIAARRIIGDNFFGKGLLITHERNVETKLSNSKEKILQSSHPFISHLSHIAGEEAKLFVEEQDKKDILLVLVSGGGSAMVANPIDGMDLQEKINFITRVMHLSVPEREVNVLKKALSKIKGGKLAESSKANILINCILSDERNHKISAISSGMTVHNKSINPIEIMDKYSLWDDASSNIKNALINHGQKKNIASDKKILNLIVGSRENLIKEIGSLSTKFGFSSMNVLDNIHSCSPEDAVDKLISDFKKIYHKVNKGKHLVISTGEVQVKVDSKKNVKGGRNQHLTALLMQKFNPNYEFCFVAIATDGMDYLEGVHGAYFDSNMIKKIEKNQDFIQSKIDISDTYSIHKRFGSLLEGEITGTNMSDFFLLSFTKT